jgi:hypothetical protein
LEGVIILGENDYGGHIIWSDIILGGHEGANKIKTKRAKN